MPQAPEAQVSTPPKQRSRNKHNGRPKDKSQKPRRAGRVSFRVHHTNSICHSRERDCDLIATKERESSQKKVTEPPTG